MAQYKYRYKKRRSAGLDVVKLILAGISLLLMVFILSIVCLGSSFGGLGNTLSTLGINVQERLGELSIEENLLIVRPSAREPVASDGVFSADLDMCVHGSVPASSVLKINDDGGLV